MADQGPSPRVRGIPPEPLRRGGARGSIPAGAGNPTSPTAAPARMRVHPRGCGESTSRYTCRTNVLGPSPRVRGILAHQRQPRPDEGSIPAGAGNPPLPRPRSGSRTVHPRGCGESRLGQVRRSFRRGPSPRVRGILRHRADQLALQRSIPAGAGNPSPSSLTWGRVTVHPRGCGESIVSLPRFALPAGPSPRVRGIQISRGVTRPVHGSIPAGAGNPSAMSSCSDAEGVHPRGCGESPEPRFRALWAGGPSPRVRGIRQRRPDPDRPAGSIPAGAGNPASMVMAGASPWVHPRGCGESVHLLALSARLRGPSPRVRGIHLQGLAGADLAGSIPAGAGNPHRANLSLRSATVHPRGCGESGVAAPRPALPYGPSPRVRGIPRGGAGPGRAAGSIPAGAGNPMRRRDRPRVTAVHPRGCGESLPSPEIVACASGPSPRVRGILRGPRPGSRRTGSIPAGAGNPRSDS